MAKVYLNGVGRIPRPRNKRTMNKTRAPKMQRKAVKSKAPM
ncbi:hypothetical protein ECW26_06380 [Escherichia coli W26]|nr:hypothetical protein ECW26_06380 [Escherichia coli W26]